MEVLVKIETCDDCRHSDHTGAFTKGGAKPCCNHPHLVEMRSDSCFDRVIPFKKVTEDNRNIFNKDSFNQPGRTYNVVKEIPTFCPLKNGKSY